MILAKNDGKWVETNYQTVEEADMDHNSLLMPDLRLQFKEIPDNIWTWIKALRSGEYQQCKKRLRKGDSFCCLGVACDLYIKAGNLLDAVDLGHEWIYGMSAIILPGVVQQWLGLNNPLGGYARDKALTGRNDEGMSFSEIADIIENNLEYLTNGQK